MPEPAVDRPFDHRSGSAGDHADRAQSVAVEGGEGLRGRGVGEADVGCGLGENLLCGCARSPAQPVLHRYVALYNPQLPQSAPGSRTPLQAMKDRHKLKPGLFKKQPYHLPGCDR